MMFGLGGPDLRAGRFTPCTPLPRGGSEIRPYQQPFSHIRLAKHTGNSGLVLLSLRDKALKTLALVDFYVV
jgi:hypothetical protein